MTRKLQVVTLGCSKNTVDTEHLLSLVGQAYDIVPEGVEEKVDLTPEETDPSKKKYIKKVTPLEDWIAEQKAQNP